MKRNLLGVRRDKMWSAWDLGCKPIVNTDRDFRRRVRRMVKRRQKQADQREVRIEERTREG